MVFNLQVWESFPPVVVSGFPLEGHGRHQAYYRRNMDEHGGQWHQAWMLELASLGNIVIFHIEGKKPNSFPCYMVHPSMIFKSVSLNILGIFLDECFPNKEKGRGKRGSCAHPENYTRAGMESSRWSVDWPDGKTLSIGIHFETWHLQGQRKAQHLKDWLLLPPPTDPGFPWGGRARLSPRGWSSIPCSALAASS